MYDGDESVAKDFPHGNAKHPEKTEKPFHNTKKSLLTEMKTSVIDKLPLKVNSDLILAVPQELRRHVVDAPRDLEQVRNAKKSIVKATRLLNDANYNLCELHFETNFIKDIQIVLELVVLCYLEGKRNFCCNPLYANVISKLIRNSIFDRNN